MKSNELSYYQPKSLKNLGAVIIALLAVAGLLNQSIGSFITFTFYYLFGSAALLFFVFVIVSALVFINQFERKSKRIYFLNGAFIVLVLTLAALFYQINHAVTDYSVLGQTVTDLGNYLSFYQNPGVIYSRIDGGSLGGLLYTFLTLLAGRVFALVVIITLFFLALGLVFWPLILVLLRYIKTYIHTIRHRNQVIKKARQTPLDQTVSPIKPISEDPEVVPTERYTYFTNQIETNTVKPAILGDENPIDNVTFNPVIIDISRAGTQNHEEIPVEDVPVAPIHEPEEVTPAVIAKEEPTRSVIEAPQPTRTNQPIEQLLIQAEVDEVVEVDTPMSKPQFIQEEVKKEVEVPPVKAVTPPLKPQPIEPKRVQTEAKPMEKPKKEEKVPAPAPYLYPPLELLNEAVVTDQAEDNRIAADEKLRIINAAFNNFKIGAQAISYTIGPSITRFEIRMNDDSSVSVIPKYIDDLNIRLGGQPGRFEPIIIGRSTSGFEVPNVKKMPVTLHDCVKGLPVGDKYNFAIPFGKNIDGSVIWGLLDEFPHLLVAGSTGSGKSVFVHALMVTLLMRNKPQDFKIMIIDPKRVEMNKYKDLPHLLCPIIKESKEAKVALDKLVDEMEQRYRLFEEHSTNKLSEYNDYAKKKGLRILPRIVVIVDEYADLVDSEKEISVPILRLAQKSRAAGIHMVVATQRPAVQIITGQIKANLPTRVALMTASATDSMTIIGQGGAEDLLGNGDMLVDCAQISRQGLVRIQGAYVDNNEIRAVSDFLREHYQPDYLPEFLDLSERNNNGFIAGTPSTFVDEMYENVKEFVLLQDTISINRIQTTFGMTFNRAKPIYDMLMAEGLIAPPDAANSSRGAKVVKVAPPSPEEERMDRNDY